MKEIEIEKRYLLTKEDLKNLKINLDSLHPISMNDVYIPNGILHKDLRLRQKNDEYVITRKRPIKDGDSTIMLETTIDLSKNEFDALSNGVSTNVEKNRYEIKFMNQNAELDIFKGKHLGLIILEIEFKDEQILSQFENKYDVKFKDITNVEWLAGGKLPETNYDELKLKIDLL